MPSKTYILAALHYSETCEPFYQAEESDKFCPRQGSGDMNYQATIDLRNAGLIKQAGGGRTAGWHMTDGLVLYVKTLMEVPTPKMTWAIR